MLVFFFCLALTSMFASETVLFSRLVFFLAIITVFTVNLPLNLNGITHEANEVLLIWKRRKKEREKNRAVNRMNKNPFKIRTICTWIHFLVLDLACSYVKNLSKPMIKIQFLLAEIVPSIENLNEVTIRNYQRSNLCIYIYFSSLRSRSVFSCVASFYSFFNTHWQSFMKI